jgi:hypothetical protein
MDPAWIGMSCLRESLGNGSLRTNLQPDPRYRTHAHDVEGAIYSGRASALGSGFPWISQRMRHDIDRSNEALGQPASATDVNGVETQ